jgi:hypothetical protein
MITKRVMRNIIRKLSNKFDVRIIFNCDSKNKLDASFEACVNLDDRVIELNPNVFNGRTSIGRFISAILHEAAHLYCKDMGYFRVFHSAVAYEYMSIKNLQTYIATAWRAERFVEKTARGWMREMYPELRYWWAYGKRGRNRVWIKDVFCADAKKVLRQKQLRKINKEKKLEREAEQGVAKVGKEKRLVKTRLPRNKKNTGKANG